MQSGRTLTSVVLFLGTSYLVIVVLIAISQRSLLYQPWLEKEDVLIARALPLGLSPWKNSSGTRIGWIKQGSGNSYPILIIHGNAGHALFRIDQVDCFNQAFDPSSIAILEYPGYGSRPGTPNRKALVTASVEAIELLHEQTKRPVCLVGESIGSVVAAEAAAQKPDRIAALLMLTPMNRLQDVAQRHFWFLPVGLILFDRYDAQTALLPLKVPMALVLAENDEVVPRIFGQKLYDSYQGPKKCWIAPGATHNEMPYLSNPDLWKGVFMYLEMSQKL